MNFSFKHLLLIICVVFSGITASASSERDGVDVNQRAHTCTELTSILNDYGSIWVGSFLFPSLKSNIALEDPVCQGAAAGSRNAICKYQVGLVTASDGACRLGVECFCRHRSGSDRR